MSCKCGVDRIAFDRVLKADALSWDPSIFWFAFGRLPGHCILQSRPRAESHNRPVAAKREHSPRSFNAVPRPTALRTLGSNIWGPRFQDVIVGIGVQRLHTRNYT